MGSKNPLKRIEAEVKRTGENLEQIGASVGAGASSAAPYLAYMIDPTGTTSAYLLAQKAKETYDAMGEAEQEEARAQAEANMAREEEAILMQEQEDAQREQERMTSERAKEAENQARERAKRLGTGRKGLLYKGATGVENKNKLGS